MLAGDEGDPGKMICHGRQNHMHIVAVWDFKVLAIPLSARK